MEGDTNEIEDVSPHKPIHRPVNPILSQLMYDVGFVERYGSGIIMMQRLCKEWENKEPRYDLHPLETKVIFDSPIQDTTFVEIDDISEQLNDRQKNALFHAEKNGQIVTKEYVEINHVSRGTAYGELRDLTDRGLLTVVGKGRGTKYIRELSD